MGAFFHALEWGRVGGKWDLMGKSGAKRGEME